MISPPGTSEIGVRLTIRVRDPEGNLRDLVGILQDDRTILRRDGSLATFDPDSITHWRVVVDVSARAGFGAPLSLRIRELEAAAATTWPADVIIEYGKWLLRASKGDTYQANSVLPTGAAPFGEPGADIEATLLDVTAFYRHNELPPAIQVPLPVYAQLDEYLATRGWQIAAECHVMVTDTSDIQPYAQDLKVTVETSDEPTPAWLAVQGDGALEEIMRRYPAHYVSVLVDGQRVAAGRIAFIGSWGILTRVFVNREYRGRGIGRIIMRALADVARTQNCGKLALQVDSRDSPAISMFESLGFRLHHRDRHRVSTEGSKSFSDQVD